MCFMKNIIISGIKHEKMIIKLQGKGDEVLEHMIISRIYISYMGCSDDCVLRILLDPDKYWLIKNQKSC